MIASTYRVSAASKFMESLDETSIFIGENIGRDKGFNLKVVQLMNAAAENPENLKERRVEILNGVCRNLPINQREHLQDITWCALVTASEKFFQKLESSVQSMESLEALKAGWFEMIAVTFIPGASAAAQANFEPMSNSVESAGSANITNAAQNWRNNFGNAMELFAVAMNMKVAG